MLALVSTNEQAKYLFANLKRGTFDAKPLPEEPEKAAKNEFVSDHFPVMMCLRVM